VRWTVTTTLDAIPEHPSEGVGGHLGSSV